MPAPPKLTPKKERAYLAKLGRAVKEARDREHVSQMELGNRSGVHRNYVGGIERGERSPTVLTILRIAHALRTTPAELLADAESRASPS